ncbi:MAG: S8 family serine peptidase [Ignavibacteria bacterium]|jgi:hypothetical protein|nr:S8 family serine peptidase [Ignavibacteria bacterium]MCU7504919.1 S8 family serine peptidase [Ignavibacteria bacterium]MCU7517789.1 S8 family serine peptidase [Ignavibacteria bacterium]
MKIYFTIFLILFLSSSCLKPQNYSIASHNPGSNLLRDVSATGSKSHVYSLIRSRDNGIQLEETDLSESLNVIVEFKAEPLFLSGKKVLKGVSKTAYTSQFATFRRDLENLFGTFTRRYGISAAMPEIKNEFYRVFNGLSITLPRSVASSLYSLPYVKKVYLDKEVSAMLKESVPLIKADSLWAQYGTGGDSIVIGILDTGIDYMHPALGGGIGKGFKVIGGYDCYNGDNDPMDDHGHGTHVAGIAAAEGSLKGVAPGTFLMALKVLGSNGQGWESTVISGIERAVDPNQDDNPEDMVDVANLSLGTKGYPEDGISTAVNNAVKLGLVCCVAAGNSGTFNSITSPGTSELAITTGASDKKDRLASISSKGPNISNSFIKPDILAPGKDIMSVCIGQGYCLNTGTSMAAPHVSGACALLKKIHRDWSPMDIKSALVSTAGDIGEEVMSEGSGRLDVLKAAKVLTLLNPCSLSFGLDDLKKGRWQKSDTVLVKNISSFEQHYSVSFTGIAPWISLQASPPEFSLKAGEVVKVIFQVSTSNNSLPKPNTGSMSFSGSVFIKSASGILHMPWAFEKASRLVMNFDVINTRFILADNKNVYSSSDAVWKGSTAELTVPPGKYDLLALYAEESDTLRIITRENLLLEGSDTLNLKPQDATNLLELAIKDKDGQLFEGENSTWIYQVSFPDSSAARDIITFSALKKLFKSSNTSARFKINIGGVIAGKDNRACVADFSINGLTGNKKLTNSFNDLIEGNISLDIPQDLLEPEVFFLAGLKVPEGNSLSFRGDYLEGYKPAGRSSWKGKIYIPAHNNGLTSSEPAVAISIAESPSQDPDKGTSGLRSDVSSVYLPPFSAFNGTMGLFLQKVPSPEVILMNTGGTLSLKNWLIYPSARHNNNYRSESTISLCPGLFGQMNEYYLRRTENSVYRIFDGNNIIAQDTLKYFNIIHAGKKKYRTELSNIRYYIEGFEAKGLMSCVYDLSLSDANPPEIRILQIRNSKGVPESRLEKGEKASIYLACGDYLLDAEYNPYLMPLPDDSTRILIRQHGENIWKELSIAKIMEDQTNGCYYSADISSMTNYDSTALDLKIVLYDRSLNSTEYTLEPAVAVGKFKGTSGTGEKAQATILPRDYALNNNYPNPFNPSTTLRYSLPEESRLKIEIFNLIGQKVATLIDESQKAGEHTLQWKADNYASGIYFCHLSAQGRRHFEKTIKMMLVK